MDKESCFTDYQKALWDRYAGPDSEGISETLGIHSAKALKERPPRRAETKPISNGCPPTFFEYTFAIKGGAK
jgi:hypothetical protein